MGRITLKTVCPSISRKLMRIIPPDLQQRFISQITVMEKQLNSPPGSCGMRMAAIVEHFHSMNWLKSCHSLNWKGAFWHMESVLLATTCYEHVVKMNMYVVRALIVCLLINSRCTNYYCHKQWCMCISMLIFVDKHCLNVGFPGGFSDTYAALCDLNEMPIREEIQWVSY